MFSLYNPHVSGNFPKWMEIVKLRWRLQSIEGSICTIFILRILLAWYRTRHSVRRAETRKASSFVSWDLLLFISFYFEHYVCVLVLEEKNSTTKINFKNCRIRWFLRWSPNTLSVPWSENPWSRSRLWGSWPRSWRSSLPRFGMVTLLPLISDLLCPAYRWQRKFLGGWCLNEALVGSVLWSIGTRKQKQKLAHGVGSQGDDCIDTGQIPFFGGHR